MSQVVKSQTHSNVLIETVCFFSNTVTICNIFNIQSMLFPSDRSQKDFFQSGLFSVPCVLHVHTLRPTLFQFSF